jgi:hypothetical protein
MFEPAAFGLMADDPEVRRFIDRRSALVAHPRSATGNAGPGSRHAQRWPPDAAENDDVSRCGEGHPMAGSVRRECRKEHTRHFDRKVDAQKWLKEAMASIVRGDYVAPNVARLTVGEWSDKWLDGYRTRRKSTVRQAEVHLKLIKEHFGAVPMASVKPSDIRGWTAQLKAERRADSYVYALHARLSQLFSDAVHDGIVPRNPCSRRTSPGTGKQRPHVATTEQVWALHNAVPAGLRPAILLGAHAGLRLAEAAALRPRTSTSSAASSLRRSSGQTSH